MPANLTPVYHRAEQRLRGAKTPEEKLDALEEMLSVIPKHKGTDHLQADLKSRIAKLRRESGKKGPRGGFSHIIPREGAGQVAVTGPPNSGKSSLVRALTHATPAVGEYPFTTRDATPGMMRFEDIAIQLVDLPPLSEQHVDSWAIDLVRHADLVWLAVDGTNAMDGIDEARRILGARNVGLYAVGSAPPRAEEGPRVLKPALIVLTGLDKPEVPESVDVVDELLERRWPIVAVSSTTGAGLDQLRRRTFTALDIVRVYSKEPGKPPDRSAPFTLPRGATVADLAERIHKDVLGTMKFARVWGTVAFNGQAVQRDHVLTEGDVVEIHT
ncbi:MAG: TGS domain-containing protein [Acidobacteria bacterium]|nr:TGS domain-containing protein [Acidobacteriota bacterium]